MARNNTPIIIGAVLFGILALGLTFFVLTSNNAGPTQPAGTAQATPAPPRSQWVAQRTIYPRTVITRDMMIESENSDVVSGAITDPKDAIGLIASRTIRPGEALTADAITAPVARVIPANIPIPVGLRGVAIWVDPDQTAAGLVDVGDRVDVVATHDLVGGRTTYGVTSVDYTAGNTIAQDLEVLAVDRSIKEYTAPAAPKTAQPGTATPGAAPAPTPVPTPPPPAATANTPSRTRVLLAASPEIAQRLITANKQGYLHITIRNPSSRERVILAERREHPNTGPDAATRARREKLEDEARQRRYARQDKAIEYQKEKELKILDAQNRIPPAIPNPSGIGSIGKTNQGLQPSNNKEVTVIRGTEKTRVIVPR